MGYVIMIAQFILSLSLLIILHEMGHFFPAKWFKTRVEKFYLFFDPWFSLIKKRVGETEYGIGWLPLGGYVKISGMIDESMDKEQMEGPPQPWEFRSKPAWQRLIIMLGGVTVNFILGFLIFGLILFTWGKQYLPSANVEYGYAVDSLGYEMGLRDGDQILALGNKPYDRYDVGVLKTAIIIDGIDQMTVLRDGREVTVDIDPKYVRVLSSYESKNARLIEPRIPVIIKEVAEDSPAEVAGLQAEDKLLGIDGESYPFFRQFAKALYEAKGQTVQLEFERDRRINTTSITINEDGKLGFYAYTELDLFDIETEKYSLARAIPAGVQEGWDFLSSQIVAFGKMFQGKIKAQDSLGGFGTITSLFPKYWDWQSFWRITAILSLILGFMNLLPIPALDGGHVMFLIYEVLTGRKVSDKVMEYATIVGFAIVIGLVLFANGLDVMRWLNR